MHAIARAVGCPCERVVLGGDHLGPYPWRNLSSKDAMAQAEEMVAAYVGAGYEKIHLDTSMGCRGEPDHLPDSLIAERAARLAVVAEAVASEVGTAPRYVIGTEVPVPGGASEEIKSLKVTRPETVATAFEAHRRAFVASGVGAAFERVIALVVQPGVEFDDSKVVVYEPQRASELSAALAGMPGLVFEAHSTDYQPVESLASLVRDGFSILKVGPALTFALREALYGLDQIAAALDPSWNERSLVAAMETEMLANPTYWQSHYRGQQAHQWLLRHYSFNDRIRYYWPSPGSQRAVRRLFECLGQRDIPEPLVSQFLPKLYPRLRALAIEPSPRTLVLAAVGDVLDGYATACHTKRSA